MMKAVILAGGLGTRLQPYTMFLPKPMLPLAEKPILEYLIEWVKSNGIRSVIVCVGYLRKTIEDYFEDGERLGVGIEYAASTRPLATAGQLTTAEDLIDGTFVCMYGDAVFDFSLSDMIERHRRSEALVTMGLSTYKTHLPYGVIDTAEGGRVTEWKEKPAIETNVNMGCYVMEPDVLKMIPDGRPYGMDTLIKGAMSEGRLVGSYVTKNGFVDIGDKASYKKAYQKYAERLGDI